MGDAWQRRVDLLSDPVSATFADCVRLVRAEADLTKVIHSPATAAIKLDPVSTGVDTSESEGIAATLHQTESEARNIAHDGLDIIFLAQDVEVIVNNIRDNLPELWSIVCSRLMNDADSLNEIVVLPVLFSRSLELLSSVLSEAVGLVLDCHSNNFGMFNQVDFRSAGGRSRFEVAEIIEVVEVLDHQLEDLRVVAAVI